jgi:ketosteroid isomerase-like protein
VAQETDTRVALAWSFLQGLCRDGDLDEAFALLSNDFVYWSNVTRTESDKAYLRAASDRRKAFVEITLELVQTMVDGDVVMVEAQGDGMTAHHDRYDSTYVYIFTVREGQLTSMREYCDTKLATEVFRHSMVGSAPALDE